MLHKDWQTERASCTMDALVGVMRRTGRQRVVLAPNLCWWPAFWHALCMPNNGVHCVGLRAKVLEAYRGPKGNGMRTAGVWVPEWERPTAAKGQGAIGSAPRGFALAKTLQSETCGCSMCMHSVCVECRDRCSHLSHQASNSRGGGEGRPPSTAAPPLHGVHARASPAQREVVRGEQVTQRGPDAPSLVPVPAVPA